MVYSGRMRSMSMMPLALLSLVAAGCPPTDQETNIAKYVIVRQERLASGDLQREIEAGTYSIDSLSLEIYEWWVHLGLAGQRASIDQFVQVMHSSVTPPPATSFGATASTLLLRMLLGFTTGDTYLIVRAIYYLQYGIQTLIDAAKKASPPDSDYMQAATDFSADLPTEETANLLFVDGFIEGVRNVTGVNHTAALMQAYGVTTNLINLTTSTRHAFNGYYAAYLSAQLPYPDGGSALPFMAQTDAYHTGEFSGVDWTPTPIGFDICKVSTAVFAINEQCVDNSNLAGILGMNVMLSPTHTKTKAVLQLDCADLNPESYVQCWALTGSGLIYAGGKDTKVCNEESTKPFENWPSKEIIDFCSNGFTSYKYATQPALPPWGNTKAAFEKKC